MAAQILPFRALAPAAKPVMFNPVSVPFRDLYSQNTSPKVLMMSKHKYRQPSHGSAESSREMFAKVEQELTKGYFEVEITGLTFRRLLCVYTPLLRSAWSHTLGGVRSLFRADPAPQA